jgi:DNA-binding response OmpR family regulator
VRVLVVEGSGQIAQGLTGAGHEVTTTTGNRDIRRLATRGSFDCIILGTSNLTDSVATCTELRREGVELPLLVLVPHDLVDARIDAFEAGADTCLGIGCPVDELLAHLRALVRRSTHQLEPTGREPHHPTKLSV